MFRRIVIHDEDFAAAQNIVGGVKLFEHSLLGLGQIRHHAMKEKSCLIKEVFGRLIIFEHNASGHYAEAGFPHPQLKMLAQ